MSPQATILIRFPDLELGDAGKAAESLREAILDEGPGANVLLQKEDPTTMDLGAILGIVLGSASVVAVARGIAMWIERKGQTIVIECDGEKKTFRATGPIDDNAARIAEALLR